MAPIRQRLQNTLGSRILSIEKPDVGYAQRRQGVARFDFPDLAESSGLFRAGFIRAAAVLSSRLMNIDTISNALANRGMWFPRVNDFMDGTRTERTCGCLAPFSRFLFDEASGFRGTFLGGSAISQAHSPQ